MMDGTLRRLKEDVLQPVAIQIDSLISPTAITLAAGVVGVAAALAAWQGSYTLGLSLWWINRTLDGLDGTLARVSSQHDRGAYLDTVLDFLVYTLIPFGLIMRQPSVDGLVILAFTLGAFYINAGAFLYLAAILERHGRGAKRNGEMTSVTMPGGVIEGAEAVVFFSLFFLLPDWFLPLLFLLGVLVVVSILQRMVWAWRHLQ